MISNFRIIEDLVQIISKAIYPSDSGWNEAIRLRDKARLEILKHYDEPDLTQ